LSIKDLQDHQSQSHKDETVNESQSDVGSVIYFGDIEDQNRDSVKEDMIPTQDQTSRIQEHIIENISTSRIQEHNILENISNITTHTPTDDFDLVGNRGDSDNISEEHGQAFLVGESKGLVSIDINDDNTIILTEEQSLQLMNALNYDNEETFHPCLECDKIYRSEKSLSLHVKSVHLKEKPYKCLDCDKAFACQNYLSEHRKVHSHENQFKCVLCDKTFSSNKVLKRHIRVHTGEKPFKCEYCGKRFAAASNLSEHRTLHTGRLPYTCDICHGKFRLWTSLKKHTVKCQVGHAILQ